MRFRRCLLLFGILAVAIALSGCSKEAPPNLDVQKKVVHTYFEGIRDHNKDKIYQTVNIGMKTKILDPDFKQAFATFDQTNGKIKSWIIVDKESWLDETNGQSVIKVKISTDKRNLPLNIDLRKNGDRWTVYSVQVSDSGKMDKDTAIKKNPHGNDIKTGNTSEANNGNKADNTGKTSDSDKAK